MGLRVALYLIGALMALFTGVSVLLLLVLGKEEAEALSSEGAAEALDPVLFFWLQAGAMPVVVGATLLYLIRVERRPPSDIGWARWRGGGPLALGALGAAGALFAAWWLAATPWVEVVPHVAPPTDAIASAGVDPGTVVGSASSSPAEAFRTVPGEEIGSDGSAHVGLGRALLFLVGFLALALLEETMFRGYVYSTLRERFSWVHAAGLTNLLELALLSGNPSIGVGGLTHIFFLGLLLAAVREKTGSLWTGILFHASWNFLLACVMGLPSDAQRYPSIRSPITLEGPEWVTGGAYGPEASWVLAALLLGGVTLAAMWVGDDAAGDDGAGDDAAGDDGDAASPE